MSDNEPDKQETLPAVIVEEPSDISLMKTPEELRRGVELVLKQYEERRDRPAGSRRLDDVWRQVWDTNDTNQNVLTLMNQGMVLFQDSYDKYMASMADDEQYLKLIGAEASACGGKTDKESVRKQNLFIKERERIEAKAASAQRNLRSFMDSITKMAHEYRQCRTQQAYWFHISQLEQFTSLIIASMHQQIHDAGVLKKISESIENASLKLFPMETKQDS